jgi:hypothetical protein
MHWYELLSVHRSLRIVHTGLGISPIDWEKPYDLLCRPPCVGIENRLGLRQQINPMLDRKPTYTFITYMYAPIGNQCC